MDTHNFEILSESIAKDLNNVYYQGDIIDADPITLEILNDYYFRDKDNIFSRGEVIEEADLESFEVSTTINSMAKDKNHNYYLGEPKD